MNYIQQFDFSILDWIQSSLRTPFLDKIMPWITILGNSGFLWICIAAILLAIKKYRYGGLTVGTALIFNVILCNVLLKPLIRRTRPFNLNTAVILLMEKPLDFSFPSGHTSASFAAATVLFKINRIWGVAAYLFAGAIAFSRLYLYMHFPTDVLCGAAIGTVCGIGAILWMEYLNNKYICKKERS